MRLSIIFIFLFALSFSFSQNENYSETELSVSDLIDGSLVTPDSNPSKSLVIIIAGSGPTNRNGNQNFLKSNNLKKLAIALAENNFASFRYDKRIVKQIETGNVDVKNMRFEDFVNDAKDVITYFANKTEFSKLYIAGHSQGSLVGMLAIDENIDGFISLAGAGQNIGDVIVDQINNTARQFVEDTKKVVKKLKAGQTTTEYPQALQAIFNLETQPFMISWMTYNPTEIIASIKQPVLIVNGTKDLQVSVGEAKLLANANQDASIRIIDNMNHVLFTIEDDKLENSKSYGESFRPINPELIESIVLFIKEN
jgi:alpha/beta superfamily hydrolase